MVARAAGVGGGANSGALGSDSCGASAVLVMAAGFRRSESLWATAEKATGGHVGSWGRAGADSPTLLCSQLSAGVSVLPLFLAISVE